MKPASTRLVAPSFCRRSCRSVPTNEFGYWFADDRLAPGRRHRIGDAPDVGVDVVGRTGPAIVLDVEDRHAERPRARQQPLRFGQGIFHADQLHDAAPVGVLAVDQDQGRVGQGAGLGAHAGNVAQGGGFGHGR